MFDATSIIQKHHSLANLMEDTETRDNRILGVYSMCCKLFSLMKNSRL